MKGAEHPEPVEGCGFAKPSSFDRLRMTILVSGLRVTSVTYLLLVFIPGGARTTARATLRRLHKQVAMYPRYGLSLAIVLHSDDYFSLGTSLSIVPESFCSLT